MIEQPIHILSTRVAHVAEDMVRRNSFFSLKRQLREASRQAPGETFMRTTILVKDGKKMSRLKAWTSALRLKLHISLARVPLLKWLFKLPAKQAEELENSLRNEAQARARKKYGIPERACPTDNILPEMPLLSLDPYAAYYKAMDLFSKEQYQAYQAIKDAVSGKKFFEINADTDIFEADNAYTAARQQFLKALAEKNPQGLSPEFQQLYAAHGKLAEIAGKYMDARLKNGARALKSFDKIIEQQRAETALSQASPDEKALMLETLKLRAPEWKATLQEELRNMRHLQQERKLLLEHLKNGQLFSMSAEPLEKTFGLRFEQEAGRYYDINAKLYYKDPSDFYTSKLFDLYDKALFTNTVISTLKDEVIPPDTFEWVQDSVAPLWYELLNAAKPVSG